MKANTSAHMPLAATSLQRKPLGSLHIKTLLAALTASAMLVGPADAAIISIPDAIGQTGSYLVTNPVSAISGEESVYLVGTVTFTSQVDTSGAWSAVDINTGSYQWGHEWNTDNLTWYVPGPYASLVNSISQGESHLVVLKIDQTTGDYSVFVNPDLGQTEAANASVFDRTGGSTADITAIRFRGGNAATNSGVIDYTGFAIYTGDDTPFAPIPEPSTALLGGLGLFALLLRRRR